MLRTGVRKLSVSEKSYRGCSLGACASFGCREDNARQGFFEHADFKALAANLTDPVNEIARFGYLTGWRKGEILPLRWDSVDRQDGTTKLSEFVFHRRGRQVVEFRREWKEACRKAHLKGRIFHDFRRTAVRNMIRAGVPQSVAMSISGHKTISMFNRYNITSAADKLEALRRTAQHLAAQPTKKEDGQVVEMTSREAASR